MFLYLSVSHSVHRADTPWADTPQADTLYPMHAMIHPPAQVMLGYTPLNSAYRDTHPPAQCMLGYTPLCSACQDMVNKRPIRIPLECILVMCYSGNDIYSLNFVANTVELSLSLITTAPFLGEVLYYSIGKIDSDF